MYPICKAEGRPRSWCDKSIRCLVMGALRAEDWTAIGALTAAGVVAISCLLVVARLSQRAHIRTRRSQREAGIWSSLAEVAQRINDGDPLARMGMTALIADRSTRRFAIEKLADMVRSMPETSLEGWCSRSTLRRIEGWVRKELKESDSGRRANCVEIVGTLKLVSCVGLLAEQLTMRVRRFGLPPVEHWPGSIRGWLSVSFSGRRNETVYGLLTSFETSSPARGPRLVAR